MADLAAITVEVMLPQTRSVAAACAMPHSPHLTARRYRAVLPEEGAVRGDGGVVWDMPDGLEAFRAEHANWN